MQNPVSLIGFLESSRPAIWRAPLHFCHLQSDLIRGLQRFDCSVTECHSRSRLVVETHPKCKGGSCAPSSSGCDHNDRCLQERLGCSASIPRDQWQMVTTRDSPAHQLCRAKAGLLGCKSLSQRQVSRNCISASRQHGRHRLYQQRRGSTLPPASNSVLRDVGLVPDKRHLCDSVSHPRKRERLCGQGIESIQGHELMEVGPNNYSAFVRIVRQISLVAGRLTKQLEDYIGWSPDPGAIHTHTFTINWAPLRGYAFPPFNLISKTLEKVTIDQTELILVVPVWQAQPWWPVLLRLLISQPVLLLNSPTLLTDPTDLNRVYPMYPRLHLAVFHISTNVSKLRAFQELLPI